MLLRLACLAPVLLGGCALPYHYSELVGARYFKVPINTYPVAVVEIDGKSTPLAGPALVDPGLREVVLEAASALPGGLGTRQVMQLKVEPCTRYYLVAEKSTSLSNRFTPRIDHQEPVPGCQAPPG
jgi:hypothetical protein